MGVYKYGRVTEVVNNEGRNAGSRYEHSREREVVSTGMEVNVEATFQRLSMKCFL